MGKRNRNIIIAALVGSIAVLTVVAAYAVINNKYTKEKSAQAVQQEVSDEANTIAGSPKEIISEELVYEEADGEYSEQQISVPVIQALAGNSDVDCKVQTMDIVSFSQSAEGNNEPEGVIVTPDTFGSDDSIYVVCIGYDVTHIEDGSFSNLRNLKEIQVDSRNPYYASVNGCLYTKDRTTLMCIPQNTTSVQVLSSITGYTPHAVDGLEQSRIDKLNSFLDGSYWAKNEEDTTVQNNNGTATVGNTSSTPYTGTVDQAYDSQTDVIDYNGSSDTTDIQNDWDNSDTTDIVADNDDTVQIDSGNQTAGPSRSSSTDFSQYVYTDEKGRMAFKYTGSGDANVIIPEGVEHVAGFGESVFDKNYDVTYVYIPKTVETMSCSNINNSEETNWDCTMYDLLYQLPNLRTVESDAYSYRVDDYGLYRPANGNKIYVWSKYEMIPHDLDKYREYGVLH